MRLFELAYCCRLFAESIGDDAASARFAQATEGAVDLDSAAHRAALLRWLREWGCRSLRVEDEERCSEALREWWEQWAPALPAQDATLAALSPAELDAGGEAYASLASRVGPRRRHRDALIDVRFGATASAKAMYAIRPHAYVPWDDAIRRALGFDGDATSYRRALARARAELEEARRDAGVAAGELPALIGRPRSSLPKLVDEHDVIRYTARHEPPGQAEVERWLGWLSP